MREIDHWMMGQYLVVELLGPVFFFGVCFPCLFLVAKEKGSDFSFCYLDFSVCTDFLICITDLEK